MAKLKPGEEILYCKACGKLIGACGSKKVGYCSKHYQQFKRFGEIKDHNQRTIWDPNEIRIFDDCAEIDTYDEYGNVLETYTIDKEDLKFLGDAKWRTVYKGRNNSPYLVTGHTVYFHKLILGEHNCEVDHIDRDPRNNRKSNLRFATRQDQVYNELRRNKSGIKGVYKNCRNEKCWHCECQINGVRYYSPQFSTKEEAAYYRYLFETIFMKDYLVCNTQEFQRCIDSLSDDEKKRIKDMFDRNNRIGHESIELI